MNENIQYILATITGLPGWAELVLILLVAVLLFGKRLPDVARSIGRSLTEFKKGVREVQDDVDKATDIEDSKKDADDTASNLQQLFTAEEDDEGDQQ